MLEDLFKIRAPRLLAATALFLGGVAFATTPAWAVHDLELFELDGNAVQNGTAPPDDWEELYHNGANDGGSPDVFTGINADPAPETIFDGGKKDIQDVSQWSWKNGSVPDKDDITNAYAAAYNDKGDLIVYFGADRFDNNGDAFLGFWFFKSLVSRNPNGTFSGTHTTGDTLVLVNFPQATNAVPLIQVVEWDPSCTKAAGPNPTAGQCAAQNLRLITGASGAGAVCSTIATGDDVCAITNEEGTANAAPGADSTAPWPYTAKNGTTGAFPFESFFEGGINLSQVIPGDTCFASFMAESRSSSSFTASLKDFVLDSFPVCGIEVDKACANPRLNDAEDMIIYDITGTVTNTGFGTVFDINVTDSPAFDTGSLVFDPVGGDAELAGGDSVDYAATITVPLDDNGLTDTVTATAALTDGGTATLSDTGTATCPNLQISAALSVTKDCSSVVTVTGSPLVVAAEVNVSGDVCNIGDSGLTDVSVVDDKAGTLLSGVSLVAPADPDNPSDTPGACAPYSGSYFPSEANDATGTGTTDPSLVVFKDTVAANGTDILGNPVTEQPAMAECALCP